MQLLLLRLLLLWFPFNSGYQFHLQYLSIPLPLKDKAGNRLKSRFKTNQTCRVFHLLRVSRTFLFILLPRSLLLILLLLLVLLLRLCFLHSFLLFCVSRARIKIVFVCGSACWFRLLSEMWNAKWEMENATRGGGGEDKKKGKTYYVCYYNAISFVFLFGLRFALLWTFSQLFCARFSQVSPASATPSPAPPPPLVGAVAKLKYHKFELITVE